MIWVVLLLVVFFIALYRVKGIDGPDPKKNDIYDHWD